MKPSFRGADAATSVLISAKTRSLPIIFVEGTCEVKLLKCNWDVSRSHVQDSGGFVGVIEAIETIKKREVKNQQQLKVLGLIDKDYSGYSPKARITHSNGRDIEVDLYRTEASSRLLIEKVSSAKCPNVEAVVTEVFDLLRPIGCLRKYNSVNNRRWDLNSIEIEKYFPQEGGFQFDRYYARFKQINRVDEAEAENIDRYIAASGEESCITILRGHDVSAVIGKWLRRRIGNRSASETKWDVIEENLRLAANRSELLRYNWARRISQFLSVR